jgi:uncharacterized protein YkwD
LLGALIVSQTLVSFVRAQPARATVTSAETSLGRMVNRYRTSHGFRAVRMRSALCDDARRHSKPMAARRALYHSYLPPIIRQFRMRIGGENVGYYPTLSRIYRGWVASASHRSILRDRRWRTMGIGVVRSGGYYWATAIFLG